MGDSVTNTPRFPENSMQIYPIITVLSPRSGHMWVKAPKPLSKSLIKGHIESIKIQLSYILEKIGNKYVKLLVVSYNKDNKFKRMED